MTNQDTIRPGISPTLSAFDAKTVGSKVLDPAPFLDMVAAAVSDHEADLAARFDDGEKLEADGAGQYTLRLDDDACRLVSGGIGPRAADPDAYVKRAHRGRVGAFLKREHAAPVTTCAVVVYTWEAFTADPQVTPEMLEEIIGYQGTASHVVVAVLAGSGPSALTPYRLVANLAGGNNEVKAWTMDDVHARACAAIEYDDAWAVVAD